MTNPAAGIAAAATPLTTDEKRRAALAQGRATAAANRAKAKAAAAAAPAAPPPGGDAGLGRSAARSAQQRAGMPGTVIGRNAVGRVIVIGRDGKPISREGDDNIDKFEIPKKEIPDGWSYQWIAETVLNEPQSAALMGFSQAGWTAVPQERHPTRPVRQGGLMLVERPTVLTVEAREEEMRKARNQIKTNVEQFMPPDGLKATGGVRRGRPVSVSADGVAAPSVELADE